MVWFFIVLFQAYCERSQQISAMEDQTRKEGKQPDHGESVDAVQVCDDEFDQNDETNASMAFHSQATDSKTDLNVTFKEETYDVCYDIPIGTNRIVAETGVLSGAMNMLMEAYKERLEKSRNDRIEQWKDYAVNRAGQIGENEDTARFIVNKFVNDRSDMRIKRNKRNTCCASPSLSDILGTYAYWREIFTHQCLFICAPSSDSEEEIIRFPDPINSTAMDMAKKFKETEGDTTGEETTSTYTLTLEEDETERLNEMKSYAEWLSKKMIPPIIPEEQDKIFCFKSVLNEDDVNTCIRQLFEDGIRAIEKKEVHAKKGLHAFIVFFGHGEEDGFCLEHDRSVMSLDSINIKVKEEWQKAINSEPRLGLPGTVNIIYSQCFGHRFDPNIQCQVECGRFTVTSLTSDEYDSTTSLYDTITGQSVNVDLFCNKEALGVIKKMEEMGRSREMIMIAVKRQNNDDITSEPMQQN